MTGAKIGAIVTSALVIMYVALLGNTALILIASGSLLPAMLGGLLMMFPILAIWAIVAELRFEQSGQWPSFDYELRPSGRPTRASADAEFGKFRDAAYADPDNWTRWFALGLAYDAASDRRRARACMRKAIKLSE
jgi:cytochrome c-type biogenesis protein CcmH/NrfG